MNKPDEDLKESKSKEKPTKDSGIEDLIIKKYGKILHSGKSIIDKKRVVIPTSPAIDMMIGGGIQEGSLVIITGPEKVGKTSMCLNFAGIAQDKKYISELCPKEGRHVYFFNIEGRLQSRDLAGILHLDTSKDRFTCIESIPGGILTAENYIDISEKLINEKPGGIFIFDSFSMLCTEEEFASEVGKKRRDDTGGLLARFCRRISNVLPVNDSIVMGVTHVMANQGLGMSQWIEASGKKLKYRADTKMWAKYQKPWMSSETQIGQEIHWECSASPIGPPGKKATSMFRYGYGLDKEREILDLCVDLSLIDKGGSWYTIGKEKIQGSEKARQILIDSPDLFNQLNKSVRQMMNLCE